MIMECYLQLKDLLKEAHRLADVYVGREIIDLPEKNHLSLNMARSSFIAHSLYAGHDRVIVEKVADYVFSSFASAS
jgi:hypothetical protein